MSRYHIYTDARHPNGTLAAGSLLSIYGDAAMSGLITLYADETTGTTLENPYTVPITGICDFWAEDVTPWVLAENDTVPHPVYVNISDNPIHLSVKDYGAVGDGTTDDSAAIQAAVDTCGVAGGVVLFPPGVYLLDSAAIWLPADTTGPTVLSGYGATIKLTETSSFFCSWTRPADYCTFGHWIIEGFGIDCDNITPTGTQGVIQVHGSHMQRVNVDDILIRDIRMYNLESATSGNDVQIGVCIQSAHLGAAEATQTSIKNVTIERVRVEGGVSGIKINGYGGVTDMNIILDNITLRDCYHDTGLRHAEGWAASNFHLGSWARGYRALVENCRGYGSGDVGLEINNFSQAEIRNTVIEDAYAACFFVTNYNQPPEDQVLCFTNCYARHVSNTSGASAHGHGFNFAYSEGVPLGCIVLDGCGFTNLTSTLHASSQGGAVAFTSLPIKSLTVHDFTHAHTGWTSAAEAVYHIPFLFDFVGPSVVTIDGLVSKVAGTRASGHDLGYWLLSITGSDVLFDIDRVCLDFDITDSYTTGCMGIVIGDSTTTAGGTVGGLRVLQMEDGSAPQAVIINGTDTLTIQGVVRVVDCDFTRMPAGGTEVLVEGETNTALTLLRDNALIP